MTPFSAIPETGERLKNFWGYSPLSFFAPKAGYSSDIGQPAAVSSATWLRPCTGQALRLFSIWSSTIRRGRLRRADHQFQGH